MGRHDSCMVHTVGVITPPLTGTFIILGVIVPYVMRERYYVKTQRTESTTQADTYKKDCKSVKQAFWWINNKMSDSWEPVKIYDRKEGEVVKWFNEPDK